MGHSKKGYNENTFGLSIITCTITKKYNNLNPIRYSKVKIIRGAYKSDTSYLLLGTAREGAFHIQITLKSTTIIIPSALCTSWGTYIIIPVRPSNHSRCKSIVVFVVSGRPRGPNYCHERVIQKLFISI